MALNWTELDERHSRASLASDTLTARGLALPGKHVSDDPWFVQQFTRTYVGLKTGISA